LFAYITQGFLWCEKLPSVISRVVIARRDNTTLLLALAILLIPFNALPYLHTVLGEMSNEGAFYPLAAAVLIWSLSYLKVLKIGVPQQRSFHLLLLFLIWVVVSACINIPEILVASTKGRSGLEKLSLQFVLFSFCILTALFVYHSMVRVPRCLVRFRRYIFVSFLVCGLYSVIEIAYLLGSGSAEAILTGVNYYIFSDAGNLYPGRVRSVSGEASWFAMYCSLVLPWILSYLLSDRRRSWLHLTFFAYFMLLVVLTKSRTAYVITAIQLGLFFLVDLIGISRHKARRLRTLAVFFAIVLVLSMIAVTQFSGEQSLIGIFLSLATEDNMSNIARFGSQLAGYKMALDHPVFGVGLGQFGFSAANYMPDWALVSAEIQEWISPTGAWATALSIYARIASETGIAGLLIWVSLWGSVLLGCLKRYRLNTIASGRVDYLGLALMVSIAGVFLSGFNADSFRFFGYWILLGVAWAYTAQSVGIDSRHTRKVGLTC